MYALISKVPPCGSFFIAAIVTFFRAVSFFCVVGLQWVLIKPPTHLDVHSQIASIRSSNVCQWVKPCGVVLSALGSISNACNAKFCTEFEAFGGQKRKLSEILRCDPQRKGFFFLFIRTHKGLLHQTRICSAQNEQLKQQHQLKVLWKYLTSD